jgi:hypothetical protein
LASSPKIPGEASMLDLLLCVFANEDLFALAVDVVLAVPCEEEEELFTLFVLFSVVFKFVSSVAGVGDLITEFIMFKNLHLLDRELLTTMLSRWFLIMNVSNRSL